MSDTPTDHKAQRDGIHKATDPTEGSEPILGRDATITIGGAEYKVRRLGVRDTFRLARIIGNGAHAMGGGIPENPTGEQLVALLTAGLAESEVEVMTILASLIGVKPDELDDPERFPMDATIDIIAALAAHQDLQAFFTKLGQLMAKLPETMTASRGA